MSKTSVLILGKRDGILHWYEHMLDIAECTNDYAISGFALNHNSLWERIKKKAALKIDRKHWESITAKALAKKIDTIQPSLIFIVDLFYLSMPILETLTQAKIKYGSKIGHWIGDFFEPRLALSKGVIDHFFFTDSSFLQDAKSVGIDKASYLPLAFNPKLFFAEASSQRSPDLLFIGAWSENRQALIESIDFPITVVGKRWERLGENSGHTIVANNVDIHQVADLYRKHQFVLNVINTNNVRKGLNMRCFEVLASGATLVTQKVDDFDCVKGFDDAIFFESPEQLGELLSRYEVSGDTSNDPHEHSYFQRLLEAEQILAKECSY